MADRTGSGHAALDADTNNQIGGLFWHMRRNMHIVCGVPIDCVSMPQAMAAIDAAISARRRLFISTPNANFIRLAAEEPLFRESLFWSDLCLADGAPVVRFARWLGAPVPGRIAGSDLFDALSRDPPPSGGRRSIYFFGGEEGVGALASAAINARSTGLRCTGHSTPGFGSVESMSDAATLDRINAAQADILVVSLGARKGQEWLYRNRDRIHAPVMVHLGAVINFQAGRVARAPVLVRRAGLEWLWRIWEEPKLATRYAADLQALRREYFGNVLPARAMRRRAGRRESGVALTLEGGQALVTLRGVLSNDFIEDVRQVFLRAIASGLPIALRCEAAEYFASGVLGQIALLFRCAEENNLEVSVDGISTAARRCLTRNGLEARILGTREIQPNV